MADDTKTTDYAKIEADKKARIDKSLANTKATVEERVAKAYEHEDPTPTQEENDAAKLMAMGQDPGEVNPPPEGVAAAAPSGAAAKPGTKTVEAEKPGGYQTRATPAKTE
jgi:hypothetical protein